MALLFIGISIANAQSTKKIPPPPPTLKKVDIIEKLPPPPPPPKKIDEKIEVPPPPTITITGKLADEFYEHNLSVMDISRQGNWINLKMKDGTIEKYNMNNKEEKKNFTDKYGKEPIPPPPPPPPPKPKKIS